MNSILGKEKQNMEIGNRQHLTNKEGLNGFLKVEFTINHSLSIEQDEVCSPGKSFDCSQEINEVVEMPSSSQLQNCSSLEHEEAYSMTQLSKKPSSNRGVFLTYLTLTALLVLLIMGLNCYLQSSNPSMSSRVVQFYIKQKAQKILALDCLLSNQDFQGYQYPIIVKGCEDTNKPIIHAYLSENQLNQTYDWVQILEMEKFIHQNQIYRLLINLIKISKEGIILSWSSSLNSSQNSDQIQQIYVRQKMIDFLSNFLIQSKNLNQNFGHNPQNILVFTKRINNQHQLKTTQDQLLNLPTLTVKNRNVRYFANLFEYLHHHKVQGLLEINCNQKCLQKVISETENLNISVQNWSGNKTQIVYKFNILPENDWINCESFQFCMDLFQKNEFLIRKAKYGVSFRNDKIQEIDSTKIIKQFEAHGFYYDQIKSLNLMRPEDKMIMLFIKGKPEEETFPFKKPTKNAIAIHLVLRMAQNIEYLREWIGYHLNLGVDKFFVYDNSDSIKSEMVKYDYLVTADTTKIGLNLACFNKTHEQIQQKWEQIWRDYYDHIIYVPWQPKNDKGEIIYGQMKALSDYVYYFKHVAKFTAYTDPDEFIFSPDNLDLEEYLHKSESQGVTTLRIRSRHFPHRVCGPNKRVTDMVDYYPHNLEKTTLMWAPKIICVTKHFKHQGSIHDGVTTQGIMVTPPENELRFNHYTFEYFNLVIGLDYRFSNSSKLLTDDSLKKRYSKIIDKICKSKCSENFAISCPPGRQFLYCINSNQTLPTTKKDAVFFKYKLQNMLPPKKSIP